MLAPVDVIKQFSRLYEKAIGIDRQVEICLGAIAMMPHMFKRGNDMCFSKIDEHLLSSLFGGEDHLYFCKQIQIVYKILQTVKYGPTKEMVRAIVFEMSKQEFMIVLRNGLKIKATCNNKSQLGTVFQIWAEETYNIDNTISLCMLIWGDISKMNFYNMTQSYVSELCDIGFSKLSDDLPSIIDLTSYINELNKKIKNASINLYL